MSSSYGALLRTDLPADGDSSWSAALRTNMGTLLEQAIAGWESIATGDANVTLTTANGATDQARKALLKFTGSLSAGRNVVVPTSSKLYYIDNATTGGFALTVKTSSGTGIAVPGGTKSIVYCDGTNVVDAANYFSSLTLGSPLPLTSGGSGASTQSGARSAFGLGTAAVENFTAGTYTPTLTNSTNVAASTASTCPYFRIGSMVIVQFICEIDPTSSGTFTQFAASLPVASNFASSGDATGIVSANVGASAEVFRVIADTTNDRFDFQGNAATTSNLTVAGLICYRVI